MPFSWQASSARFSGASLSSQGVYWSMIASTKPPSAAAWRYSARCASWHEKPTNRALPDFLIASIVSFELLALGPLERLVAVVAPDPVDEEQVDVIDLKRRPAAHRAGRSVRWACSDGPW